MSKVDGISCPRVKTTPGYWPTCPNVYLFSGDNAIFSPSTGVVLHWAVYEGTIYPFHLGYNLLFKNSFKMPDFTTKSHNYMFTIILL